MQRKFPRKPLQNSDVKLFWNFDDDYIDISQITTALKTYK